LKWKLLVGLLWLAGGLHAICAQTPPLASLTPQQIFERYRAALEQQQQKLDAYTMEARFIGRVPSVDKAGSLRAFRSISPRGDIRYKVIESDGDELIKRQVIARYMTAEVEATNTSASIAIVPENYRYDYQGLVEQYGRQYHVFELNPRHQRPGLFRGQLWLDPQTFLPLREYGLFASSPSVFLRSVYFVRDYWIVEGIAIPRRIISNVDVRLVGEAYLEIWYSDFDFNPAPPPSAPATEPSDSQISRRGVKR
jgi:hypothetical protein